MINETATDVLEMAPIVMGLDSISIFIATLIGYIGVGIMAYGALRGIIGFVYSSVMGHNNLPMIRFDLGKHLALGLEFLVGKDIVESIVHPTWDDLGKLAAIIVIRTVVTFFLARELKEVEEELQVEERELKILKGRKAA